jgi:hypothetical protein
MFAISKKFSLANYRLVDDQNPIQPMLDCTGGNPLTLQNSEPSLRLSPSFLSLPPVAAQGIAKAELPPSMLPSQGHRGNDAIPFEAAASFSKSTLGRRMILLAACLLPILGCSASFTQSLSSAKESTTDAKTNISMSISPQSVSIVVGQSRQFTAAVSGTKNTSITWSVNQVAGGNSTTGTISSTGLYRAPSASPAGGSVTVAATSTASASVSASAAVAIQDIVAVSPASASVQTGGSQQFSATVNGVRNTSMAWRVGGAIGGNSTLGTISTSGLYSAPAVVPSSTVTVSAVEASGSLASANASVTIAIPKVAITPLTATIAAGRSQQFTVTVTNALNKAVSWSVNGVAGGDSATGTISSTGLYYAPSAPAKGGSVTIAATSAADSNISAGATVTIPDVVTVTPASISVASGKSQQFAASINGIGSSSVLWSVGGVAGGNSTLGAISAIGLYTAPQLAPNAPVEVTATEASDSLASGGAAITVTGLNHAPITITYGGTYTGNWVSGDPGTPAILVQTNEPVFIENSSVTGKGNLIIVKGSGSGANVTIQNVTGTALDPGIAGRQRGSFFFGTAMNSLAVTNCSMTGVSFGVYVEQSTLTALSIGNNVANNMEDRASDGNGGFTTVRPSLGHFVILSGAHATSGGDISWNQVIDADGNASVEDIINIFGSSGQSVANSIRIHDNYLQGAFSPAAVDDNYSGSGIMMDGRSNSLDTATGFVQIYNNQIVHTANAGIGLNAGHDISATDNSIVSCGKNASGNWIATSYAVGMAFWNEYKTSVYFNNSVSGTTGGLVRQNAAGTPGASDLWAPAVSPALNNVLGSNDFTNPCLAGGDLTLAPENAEFEKWQAKLASASESIGSHAASQ